MKGLLLCLSPCHCLEAVPTPVLRVEKKCAWCANPWSNRVGLPPWFRPLQTFLLKSCFRFKIEASFDRENWWRKKWWVRRCGGGGALRAGELAFIGGIRPTPCPWNSSETDCPTEFLPFRTIQSRVGVFALPLSFRWQRTCEVLSCEQWRRSHWKTTGSLMLLLELIFAITLVEVMKIAATRVARAQDLQLT
jgi:hypothetical protein